MSKKIVLSFLVAILLLANIAVPFAHAQTQDVGPWYNQNFNQFYGKVYDKNNQQEIFGERYTAAQVQWVIYGFMSLIVNLAVGGNPDATDCIANHQPLSCGKAVLGLIPAGFLQGKTSSVENQKSIFALVFEDRPFSGVTYTKNILKRLRIIPEASAQTTPGFGFSALEPIQDLWLASRNVSYALFVFIIIAIAFMIMFRLKINPQTVITVQSALPKIAIAIVLVTFSYAIAGFAIDLMYVIFGLISIVFGQMAQNLTQFLLQSFGVTTNASALGYAPFYFQLLTQGPFNLGILSFAGWYFAAFLGTFVFLILGLIPLTFISTFSQGPISGFSNVVMIPILAIIGIIVVIVLAIYLIILIFKTMFLLAKTFGLILLLVLIAPFQIMLGVVSANQGFGVWLRSLLSKLAVFPIVGTLFLLAFLFLFKAIFYMLQIMATNIKDFGKPLADFLQSRNLFTLLGKTPVYVSGWPPLLSLGGELTTPFIFLMASLIIFVMIPKAADMVESLIAGKPFNYGSAIGEATAIPAGLAGGAAAERLQRFQDINKNRTAFQNAQRVSSVSGSQRPNIEYLLSELTRRLTGGGR